MSLQLKSPSEKEFIQICDFIHEFEAEISGSGAFTHVRLNIFPDGGVSRLRLWGNKK